MGREWATGTREDGGIGMRIGGDRQTIQLKRADGTVVASVSRSVSKKSSKKKKRLQYNFKEISRQIMAAKTSVGAGSIAARARRKTAILLRKRKNEEYDEQEVEQAIIHARKMERIAKKRKKHLEEEEKDILHHMGLVLNIKTYECFLNEKPLVLTPTEFAILRILLENKGRVIGAEELFHRIWQDEYYCKSNNTIPVHIRHLREKLNDTMNKPKYIKTIWGVGYKIEES